MTGITVHLHRNPQDDLTRFLSQELSDLKIHDILYCPINTFMALIRPQISPKAES